ncbi:CHAT domain-containing protein [Lacinutrix sp. MEBiC02404]
MNRILFIICFFAFGNVFSQDLENAIYEATEIFNDNKSEASLIHLNEKISVFESRITSEDEYFAFINLLANKAYYLDASNKQQQAIATYEKAWTLYKKQEVYNYDITEYCLIPLGILYHKTKDYTNAENIIKQYIFLAEQQNNNSHKITGTINLANLYQSIGSYALANETANKGLQFKDIKAYQLKRLKSLKSRSALFLNNNVVIIDNGDVFSRNLNKESEIDITLKYEQALKNKDYKAAQKNFYKLKNKKPRNILSSRDQAKLFFQEGQLYYLLKDTLQANRYAHFALKTLLPGLEDKKLPTKEALYPENTFIDLFDLLAEIQTSPEKALACYDLSFYASSLIEQNITSQKGQLINLYGNRVRSEKCLNILYQLQATTDATNYTERAFQYAENQKASILKDIKTKKSLLELHPEDSLLITQSNLVKQEERLTNKLINTPISNASAEEKNTLRQELNAVSIALKTRNNAIDKKYAVLKNSEALPFEDLKKKLTQDHAVLVEYFYGKHDLYQFIFSTKTASFHRIPLNEETNNAISTFITYFGSSAAINNDILKFTEDAFTLYKTLLLDKIADQENVIIIPDSKLNFIPFDALLTAKTTSSSFSKMPFLVKKHKLVYNANASIYLNQKNTNKKGSLLGVFPVFEGTNQELIYSKKEAESIEKIMNADLLFQTQATKRNFIDKATNYSILHLSTHAKSGNFQEPASIDFYDETLTINELYSLNMNVNLVVLSACETGVGTLQKGEGALSIARGFQYAGAKNVLFSLWQINDLATSQIMTSFYKNYNKYNSEFIANNTSKIEYLNNDEISNIKKSPYYWSAFVYYGTISQKTKIPFLLYSIIAILSLILLVFLFLKINRKNT